MAFTQAAEAARKALLNTLCSQLTVILHAQECALATIEDPRSSESDRTIARREIDDTLRNIAKLEERRRNLAKLGSADRQ